MIYCRINIFCGKYIQATNSLTYFIFSPLVLMQERSWGQHWRKTICCVGEDSVECEHLMLSHCRC